MSLTASERNGIICAGNWIVDLVSFIDSWPHQGELCYISNEVRGLGGCSANQVFALSKMDPNLQVLPIGCIGNDDYGDYILNECAQYNIKSDYLSRLDNLPTSHTLVVQSAASGQRTFLHHKGANGLFGPEHIPLEQLCDYKIFSFGYLLLLDRFDCLSANHKTIAGDVLKKAQDLGFITCLDTVSENSERFREIIPASLPYTDYLIVNELEAARIVNWTARDSNEKLITGNLKQIGQKILALGVKNVIIHCPEGAQWCNQDVCEYYPNTLMPSSEIVSSVGAGDAFCSGVIYGIHQGYTRAKTIKLAANVAKACLKGLTATDNIPNVKDLMAY